MNEEEHCRKIASIQSSMEFEKLAAKRWKVEQNLNLATLLRLNFSQYLKTIFLFMQEYITCAEVWIDYPLKYFTTNEVNTLLGNIVKNMLPDRVYENHYPQVEIFNGV